MLNYVNEARPGCTMPRCDVIDLQNEQHQYVEHQQFSDTNLGSMFKIFELNLRP